MSLPDYTNEEAARIFDDIAAERAAQDEKWGVQRHHDFEWSTILMEEIGEVAQAALHDSFGGRAAGTLREELIQSAAVIVAWVEDLDQREA